MAVSFVAVGSVSALTTVGIPGYPAGLAAGDLLLLTLVTDAGSAAIPAQSGWTQVGTSVDGGGLGAKVFSRTAAGTETGTFTTTGTVTGGTKGTATIEAYRPQSGYTASAAAAAFAADADSSSTAFSATGASTTAATGSMWAVAWAALAPSGSYSASAAGAAISQAGATVSSTASYSGRTGTNTITYGGVRAGVTVGGTGAPTMSATCVGANAAGVAPLVLVTESASAASSLFPTAVAGATKVGAAATIEAGLADSDDSTGAQMSGVVGDTTTLTLGGTLVAGTVGIALRLAGVGGGATVSVRLYAADGTTPVAAAQTFVLTTSLQTVTYALTQGESDALTNRTDLVLKITQTA